MYSINLQMVCNMKTLTNAFGFVVIVFTTQIWEVQVASHTKQMLIIRKGKSFVSKMVEKNICETAITITNITVAKRKKRLWLFVIFKILKCSVFLLILQIVFQNNHNRNGVTFIGRTSFYCGCLV